MKHATLSVNSIEQLAANAISSASASFGEMLVSASELTSVFVPPDLRPIWTRSAQVASRTIEILPFAAAAAVQDITRGFRQRTAQLHRRENLGARLRREEFTLPVPIRPEKLDKI